MPKLLTNDELRDALHLEYSSKTVPKEAKEKRKHNIDSFIEIDRAGLEYNRIERKILLYVTLQNEKIFIQFPGKESVNSPKMPADFRPKLQLADGSFMQDASFGFIWDILDEIGKEHKAYLSYVAAIFLRMGYMHDYLKVKELYKSSEIILKNDKVDRELTHSDETLEWYKLNLSDDVWHTLNDKIGPIQISKEKFISFEGFIKFVDLLFQNEDCKYYYKNVFIKGKKNYTYSNGRPNSSAANLLIINYFEGNEKISNLLNSFQKSRGVASFRKKDYSNVTDGIVTNVSIK